VRPVALAFLTGLSGVLLGSGAPAAGHPPLLELSTIYAARTDAGVSIDPQLRDLPQLTRDQPFVRYNLYRLLDRRQMPFAGGKGVEYALANGRTLRVQVEAVNSDAGERRYQVQAQISEPGKTDFLRSLAVTASENEAFFVGGQTYQGGTLFIELQIRRP